MIDSKPSEVPCCICDGEVIEFSVPNQLWNMVMRPDGHETNKEYLCFNCWNKKLLKFIMDLKYPQCTCDKYTGLNLDDYYKEDDSQ